MRVAILLAALLLPAQAEAANRIPCGPRAEIIDYLAAQHGEAPVARGLTAGGQMLEILTDEFGATWSLVMTEPNGTSCLVFSGEDWRAIVRLEGQPL